MLIVSVCGALATPGCWLVKVRLAGLTLKAGAVSPVPPKVTVCVRRASTTVSVPVTAPPCVGAKTTLIVQIADNVKIEVEKSSVGNVKRDPSEPATASA